MKPSSRVPLRGVRQPAPNSSSTIAASSTVEDPRNIDAQITVGAGSGEYWAQAVGEVIANSYQE
jgi:hypothetical protein